jgi:hypothetical protein
MKRRLAASGEERIGQRLAVLVVDSLLAGSRHPAPRVAIVGRAAT